MDACDRTWSRCLIVLGSVGFGTAIWAQEYTISRWTIDDGGSMRSAGDGFELSGTIGQPDAGLLAGGAFELSGGFWFALALTDCNEDGAANLLDLQVFETCLDGPSTGVPAGCACFDIDASGTIDLRDFAAGQSSFDGS